MLGLSLRRKVQDIEAVWKELDLYSSGSIRHSEVIQGLRMLGVRMQDATVFALMKRFADPKNASGDITKPEFVAFMRYLLEQVPSPKGARDEEAIAAALAAAERAVAAALPQRTKARMLGALAPFDTAGAGALPLDEFRAMLDELGARLDDAQFAALAEKYDDLGEGAVDLRNFAGRFLATAASPAAAGAALEAGEGGIGGATTAHGAASPHAAHHHEMRGDLEDDGGLGLGGPAAVALIKRNTEGTYPSLLSSRKGYPPWAAVGVRPLVDPLTAQPLTMDKLVRAPARRPPLFFFVGAQPPLPHPSTLANFSPHPPPARRRAWA